MSRFWQKMLRDNKGAVTVFVTLLLIPALLITGSGVDLATLYAARAIVDDGNELALNALMADYDQLLHDLYGLYAVSADDGEMKNIITVYLSLALFSGDSPAEDSIKGRFLFNNAKIKPEVIPAANANLQNREMLRRQIEEYVRLRAPAFMIEKVLDQIEKFTKFLPDLTAVIQKFELDEKMAVLFELYQQLYYRMRFHDSYIYFADIDGSIDLDDFGRVVDIASAAPQGLEVDYASELSGLLRDVKPKADEIVKKKDYYRDCKDDYKEKVRLYDEKVKAYDKAQAALEALDSSAGAKKIMAAENKVRSAATAKDEAKKNMDNAEKKMNDALKSFNQATAAARNWVSGIQGAGLAAKQSKEVSDAIEMGGIKSFGDFSLELEALKGVVYSDTGVFGWVMKTIDEIADTVTINPFKWLAEFEEEKTSKYPPVGAKTQDFLDNLVYVDTLMILIYFQKTAVEESIDTLHEQLKSNCSEAMRMGMQPELENCQKFFDIAAVGRQYKFIMDHVNSYFQGYSEYLKNPEIKVNNITMKLNEIESSFDFQADDEYPVSFNHLLKESNPMVKPYFDSINPSKYVNFCDDEDVFVLYAKLYDQYGDDTYFGKKWKDYCQSTKTFFSTFFSGMMSVFQDLSKGIALEGDGAACIPSEVYNELREREAEKDGAPSYLEKATSKLAEFGKGDLLPTNNSFWNIMRAVIEQLDYTRQIFESLKMVLEEDGILYQFSLVTYDAGMFSCYTTQKKGSFAGYDFNKNLNYQLGWEQEYLLFGDRTEEACLAAAAGLMFSVRLVFNFLGTVTVPSVSAMCTADVEPITNLIVRAVLTLGETFVDVYQLRTGKEVPIIKFLDDHWTFGNPQAMGKAVKGVVTKVAFGAVTSLIKAGGSVGKENYPELYKQLKKLDAKKIYSAAVTYGSIARLAEKKGILAPGRSALDGLSDSISEISTRFSDPKGYAEDILSKRKSFSEASKGAITDPLKKLENIINGNESELMKEIANKAGGKLTDLITPKFSYSDYMNIFLFLTPTDVLVSRTGDLIAINMTNVQQNTGVVPKKSFSLLPQKASLDLAVNGLFNMSTAHTAFELNTDVSLDLLFLSSFIAQGRAKGISSGTVEFSATANRGY